MIRAVPDTNVRFSADLTVGGTAWLCLDRLKKLHRILTSEALLSEYAELLERKTRLTPDDRQVKLTAAQGTAELVRVSHCVVGVCRDADDHRVLECALSGKADWIVSGDKDLLVLDPYERIRIVSPTQAMELLGSAT